MTDETRSRPLRLRDAELRVRRRSALVFLIVGIVVLAVLVVVADIAVRAYAEQRVASEIESRLPETVTGDVDVEIGGLSVFAQYLGGRFDDVKLRSDNLVAAGLPVVADISLRGVPVDTSQTVDTADGSLVLSEAAIADLLAEQGVVGDVSLRDGRLAYEASTTFLGQEFTLNFDATPSVEGGALVFTPGEASVGGGGVNVRLDELFPAVGADDLTICVADRLPPSVTLESVEVNDGSAVLRLAATDLPLDEQGLSATGSCG